MLRRVPAQVAALLKQVSVLGDELTPGKLSGSHRLGLPAPSACLDLRLAPMRFLKSGGARIDRDESPVL